VAGKLCDSSYYSEHFRGGFSQKSTILMSSLRLLLLQLSQSVNYSVILCQHTNIKEKCVVKYWCVVGGYSSASAYGSAAAASPYSTSYPLGAVSGYTSYGGSTYGSNAAGGAYGGSAYGSSAAGSAYGAGAASYTGGYAAYGSSSY